MDVFIFIAILSLALGLTRLVTGPGYCKCKYCEYKIRQYEIHKCKVSGRRHTCK
jgi:hypothetical protein